MKKISLLTGIFMLILGQVFAQSAVFTADSPRCVNDTMHFTPGNPGGLILQEVWDFGDGTVVTYLPPATFPVFASHVYSTYGIFMVMRTVTFGSGPVSFSLQVLVNPQPSAYFSFPATNCIGQPVQFTDLSYIASGFPGYINQWVWDFGDGTYPVVIFFPSSPNISHTFAGYVLSHNVTLTVTSSSGCSSSVTRIVGSTPNPVANFSFSAIACAGQPVSFTDLSQTNGGGSIISFNWNFGDPASGVTNTSSLQNPVHIFSGSGVYSVTLTVTNTNGCSNSMIKNVVINPPPTANFTFPGSACSFQPVQFMDMSTSN
jgi:PKD repeat protein